MLDVKIETVFGDGMGELTEEQKKFIEQVINTFTRIEKVEKVEVAINEEEKTAYVVVGKDFLTHKEVGMIYRNLVKYEFDISFDDGKIEVLVGDH